ncbi:MATE family efflux transporter [Frondihabitans sp. 762G35]|uniref:MATE family efflux transporter n=1 Tax=Frondihabitans sp. 762G35 TaxID=1446794 RepID=UPI000E7062AC|nr:MATE family efflux transporter [Frondihabitans sp. 762G35]
MSATRALDRDIARLAVPALGALIAEPLFLLTDTALVGHLGAAPLAGLGVASVILQTAVGLLIFLAYATTPTVARRLGAGDRPGALRAGIDGLWFALGVGVVLAGVGLATARPLVDAFDTSRRVADAATTYLTISVLGLPAMLVVIAATGLLRGLQDTRTPLVVATVGFAANALLNAVFLYGFGWGIAGSAWGTVTAQAGMAAVYAVIAVRAARAAGVPLRPGLDGVGRTASSGAWLLLRNACLRAAMLATVSAAATLGVRGLAAVQIALTLFSALAFALDALAIAGQALVGHALGAGDRERVRRVTRRLLLWGVAGGAVLGLLLAAVSGVLAPVFTTDAEVARLLPGLLLAMSAGIPVAGFVFVLDGVLLGAGDARYLGLTGLVNVAVYLPLLAWSLGARGDGAPVALWFAFGLGYIGARAVTLGLRAAGSRWVVTGAR